MAYHETITKPTHANNGDTWRDFDGRILTYCEILDKWFLASSPPERDVPRWARHAVKHNRDFYRIPSTITDRMIYAALLDAGTNEQAIDAAMMKFIAPQPSALASTITLTLPRADAMELRDIINASLDK